MKITALNNISKNNNYNNINFASTKQQRPQHEPRHSSSTLKAIPLATLIAMSPLNAPSATHDFDQNPEKIIMTQGFKDGSKNLSVRFLDTDGDENTAEKIDLQITEVIQRRITDKETRQKIPVKYAIVNNVDIDSLKQINITHQYEDGDKAKTSEYFIIGDASFYSSAQKAMDGSNKIIRPAQESEKKHYTYQIPKQVYDYLIDTTSDGIPKKIEEKTRFISTLEEAESWGL